MLTPSLVLLCQFLEPSPPHAELGTEVVVVARDARNAPIADLPLSLEAPAGAVRELGRTDARGELRFEARPEGELTLAAQLPRGGPRLVAPLRVVPAPRRWLWFVVCGSIGAGVLLLARRDPVVAEPAPRFADGSPTQSGTRS